MHYIAFLLNVIMMILLQIAISWCENVTLLVLTLSSDSIISYCLIPRCFCVAWEQGNSIHMVCIYYYKSRFDCFAV